jgi:adenylylsulfate reductase subunit A
MTQMEHRLVVARFKDGYGPVGMWFLLFKSVAKNAYGEITEEARGHELNEWAPYGTAKPVPTPLRNHLMLNDIKDGKGPHYMRTDEALQKMYADNQNDPAKVHEIESDAWEDFLDMTMSQAHLWASENIDPAKTPSEIMLTEPYLMGSHASACGAWCSGPDDVAPSDYHWGYNRMTTVKGLFAAGDSCGASPHKFSSGSHTEGRLAGKAAVQWAMDNGDVRVDQAQVDEITREIYRPFEVFGAHQHETTRPELNANYMLPKQALLRLQKTMDEYAAGSANYYITNAPTLERGLDLMALFKEDCTSLAARDLHDLLRCWEIWDRVNCAEASMRHMLFREETRWPGYYYRGDYPRIDDENWKCFVNSRRDPKTGEWELQKIPFQSRIP